MIDVRQIVIEVIAQTISVVFSSFLLICLGLEIKSAVLIAVIINGLSAIFINLFILKNK